MNLFRSLFSKEKLRSLYVFDGKAFHTFTRGFDKPFDSAIEYAMTQTMLKLCESIQGCVLGYTQSDEITLVLCDYQKPDTSAWFDYQVQKMCSVAASMATYYFLMALNDYQQELWLTNDISFESKIKLIAQKIKQGAFFDARCFNLPCDEVVNCLIWRQQDAVRNSVQALAQSLFSHKSIQGMNCKELKKKIFNETNMSWDILTNYQKRGACAKKITTYKQVMTDGEMVNVPRSRWIIDMNTPDFVEDRNYIKDKITF